MFTRCIHLKEIDMESPLGKLMVGGKVIDSKVINGKAFIIIEKHNGYEVFYYEVELAN